MESSPILQNPVRSYRKVCCLLPATLTKIWMLHICTRVIPNIHIHSLQWNFPKLFAVRQRSLQGEGRATHWIYDSPGGRAGAVFHRFIFAMPHVIHSPPILFPSPSPLPSPKLSSKILIYRLLLSSLLWIGWRRADSHSPNRVTLLGAKKGRHVARLALGQ